MSRIWLVLMLALGAPFVLGQVSLKAPTEAPAGSAIEVSWTGSENPKDFVTIVEKGAPEGKYNEYRFARVEKWTAIVPDEPGDYEIRYLGADRPYPTLASLPLRATPVSATLSVAGTVPAGSPVSVSWTGPDNPKDFITIVAKGSPEKKYGKYLYTRKGSPLELRAPEDPGDYEVRYLTGSSYFTLASTPLKITATTATITGPAQVEAGATFEFSWTGPDNQQDFITIVEADAPDGRYGKYVYTRRGSPTRLRAPDQAGDFQLRYLTGGKSKTLAAVPIRVISANASLTFENKAGAGSVLSVSWTGPNNAQDYITIVKSGSSEGSYDRYRYTARGNPLDIPVPEVIGTYEVRYVTGQKGMTLASSPLEVTSVTASLDGPERVKGSTLFEVRWQGPGNVADYIAIIPKGGEVRDYTHYTYTRRGNPVTLRAPDQPGDYELHYLTGRKHISLAKKAIVVEPPEQLPGTLLVRPMEKPLDSGDALEVILDASGSMLQRLDGKRRIEIAREVLVRLVREVLPPGSPFALRVFGHKEADACRTDLEVPLGPLDPEAIAARIAQVQAMNKARTPIAHSLSLVAEDLAGVTGQRVVVLITDGEETCEGDPTEAVEALKATGIDVRLNIVGFAIEEKELRQTFKNWADLGQGVYFDANNADGLDKAMGAALQTPFKVLDQAGQIIAEGVSGGDPLSLLPGTYQVQGISQTAKAKKVTIVSERETVINY